jgi:hypothetical protein
MRRLWIAMAMWLCLGAAAAAADPCAPTSAKPTERPARVKVGVYVNDIHSVDLQRHAFSADFYVWFRWKDPAINPVCTFELMNVIDQDQLRRAPVYEKPLKQPDGSRYQLARIQGVFSSKFSLARYPFDDQVLHIDIEDSDMGSDELIFEPDTVAANPELTLPGYRIGAARLEVGDKPYATAFGDLAESSVGSYSRAIVGVPILRPWISGAVKKFLPIALIILRAASALLLAARHIDAQIGLTITALLALVAQQFAMSTDLPEVGYLLMLDQIYIASYGFILALIAIVVLRSRSADRNEGPARTVRGVGALTIMLSIYSVAVSAVVWANLWAAPAGK